MYIVFIVQEAMLKANELEDDYKKQITVLERKSVYNNMHTFMIMSTCTCIMNACVVE